MKTAKGIFDNTQVPRWMLVVSASLAVFYLYVIGFWFQPSNIYLFSALMAGQLFLIWQVLTYIFTVWNTEKKFPSNPTYRPPVDVFVTVAGEPIEIVEETLRACQAMEYPNFRIYILNDSYVAKRENWREYEELAQKLGVGCVTRLVPGGAKAGNINNALRNTESPLVVIFDADHIPHRDFLKKTIPYFVNPKLGFVQSPQYYKNADATYVATCAWEQQELFFGPICKGKNNYGVATMCGTNMVFRRDAINEVGGMCEESIAEDFITGMFMHERGWSSIYVHEVLAEGLAPEDFLSYYKQQHRWARGALDIIFRYNLIFRRGLKPKQKIQYLSSVSHFLSGIIVVMNALFPVIYLFTGQQPFVVSTMSLAAVFLPYMFVTLYVLRRSSDYNFTFNALAFSMGGFGIHISALWSALTGAKTKFAVTSKTRLSGNFVSYVIPHLTYMALVACGVYVGFVRSGFTPPVANNAAWALISCSIFMPFVYAALPKRVPAESAASEHDLANENRLQAKGGAVMPNFARESAAR